MLARNAKRNVCWSCPTSTYHPLCYPATQILARLFVNEVPPPPAWTRHLSDGYEAQEGVPQGNRQGNNIALEGPNYRSGINSNTFLIINCRRTMSADTHVYTYVYTTV